MQTFLKNEEPILGLQNLPMENGIFLKKFLPLGIWSMAEYSETLGIGLGLDQFYGLGLGLEAETQIISVSDSVSILRL